MKCEKEVMLVVNEYFEYASPKCLMVYIRSFEIICYTTIQAHQNASFYKLD